MNNESDPADVPFSELEDPSLGQEQVINAHGGSGKNGGRAQPPPSHEEPLGGVADKILVSLFIGRLRHF